ncbi:MAG: hypothetical protein RBT59_06415 [Arcobacteraceae bacterium]|jgi:hypothetical protein|nr:hypothetical protein [Arcobacteraceae bacterium]
MKIVHFIIVSFLIIGFSGCSVWQPQKQTDVLINKKVINLPQTANYLKMSPNGKYVLFTCTDCGRILFPSKKKPTDIYVWDIEKDEKVIQIDREDYNMSHMQEGCIFTPDSENILFFNRNGMNIYNIVQNKIIETINTKEKTKKMEEDFNKKYPNALTQPTQNMMGTFSPDGKYYITKSFYNKDTKKAPLLGGFILFDAKTFEPVHYIYDIYPSENKELVFSEDGRYFVDTYSYYEKFDFIEHCNKNNISYNETSCEKEKRFKKFFPLRKPSPTMQLPSIRVWEYETLQLKKEIKNIVSKPYAVGLLDNEFFYLGYSSGIYDEYYDKELGKKIKKEILRPIDVYKITSSSKVDEIKSVDSFGQNFLKVIDNKYLVSVSTYPKNLIIKVRDLLLKETIQTIETSFDGTIFWKQNDSTNSKFVVFGDSDEVWIYDIHIPNIVKNEE